MKIFAMNPGSTSTKIAVVGDGEMLYAKNVVHGAGELARFENVSQQLPYRKETILAAVNEAEIWRKCGRSVQNRAVWSVISVHQMLCR